MSTCPRRRSASAYPVSDPASGLFQSEGFAGGVPETPKDPPRNPVGVFNEEDSGVCSFFVVCGAGTSARVAICGHRPRAGCLVANQAMPVQFRLTAPFFQNPIQQHGGRQLAQQSLQNSAGSGQHRDAVLFLLNRGGARWEGSGLISRLRAGSIPAPANFWAARSFSRSPALQAGEHGAKPWRSTISSSGW